VLVGLGLFRRTVKAGSYVFFKTDDPFKEYFQQLKTCQFLGHVQSFFDRVFRVLGLKGF